MEKIAYTPIGIIRTPFTNVREMPIQPSGAKNVIGTVEVFEQFQRGLKDLNGFSHIILIYHFHKVTSFKLEVTPFLDQTSRGVFATRAPVRPNPIGLSIVALLKIENNIITFKGADILDNTPLLDIKPFVPPFDVPDADVKIGWLEKTSSQVELKKSDDRFLQ